MSRKDIEAGNAFVRLTLQDNAFIRGLTRNSERLKSFGTGMAKVGAGITAVGASVLGPLAGAVHVFSDLAGAIDDIAQRTGTSAEFLTEIGHAAFQSGTDISTVEKAITKMQKTLGNDLSKGTVEALAELGLNAEQLQAMNPEQQFEAIAAAVGQIEDPTKKAAAAMEFFGKSGTMLLPMIADIDALREQARELGFVMSTEAAQMGAKLGDTFDNLWNTVKFGAVAIGEALAPTLIELGDIIQKVATTGLKWIQDNKQLVLTIATVAAGVTAAGVGITGLGLSIAGIGVAMGGIVSGFGVLATVLGVVLSPLGLIAGALTAGIYLWTQYTESGQNAVGGLTSLFGELWATAKDTFGGIYDALASGDLMLAGRIAITGLQVALLQGVEALSGAVGGALGDFLGTIGTQLAGGDLSGAWNTTLEGLYSAWAGFAEGMVAMFTQAMRGVLDAWETTTGKISDWILKNATEGGFLGKLALIGTGVDMEEEARRAARMGQSKSDFLGQAQSAARDQLAGTANSFRSRLDRLDSAAQQRTQAADTKFNRSTAGGAAGASDAVAMAQKELDLAIAAAAKAREESNKEREKQKQQQASGPAPDDISKLPGKVFSTFSATAFQLAGIGQGSTAEKQLDVAKKTLNVASEQKALQQSTLDFIRATGATYV